MKFYYGLVTLFLCFSFVTEATNSLSYSGRLVNPDGSPVTGPVDLNFELAHTNPSGVGPVLCNQLIPAVPLTNGVFHVKLNFICPSSTITKVLNSTPPGENAVIRVTNENSGKSYSFQALHSLPYSQVSNQLVQMGAVTGQVLSWNGSEWAPANVVTTDGTVKNILTGSGLIGGPITDSGTIAIAIGGVEDAHLATGINPAKLSGTRDSTNYLKGDNSWSSFGGDVLTTILTGFSTASSAVITATDSILQAFGKTQAQLTNKIDKTGGTLSIGTIDGVPTPVLPSQVVNKQYVDDKIGDVNASQWTTAVNDIFYNTGNVGIGTSTPASKLDVSGGVQISKANNHLVLKDTDEVAGEFAYIERNSTALIFGTNNGVTSTIGLTVKDGNVEVAGQVKISGGTPGAGKVLTSDASGLASWTDPASTTPTGAAAGDLSGTYPNPTIASGAITDAKVAAGANIDQSKIANLTTDLANKQTSDSDLTALAGLGTTGVLVRTGTGTATTRSIVGTANRVSVTNGDGVGGNPTINISSTLLPSPVAGDAGKILKATGADATSWESLLLSDITTALGFTPINKDGDSITSGIFNYSGTSFVRVQNPVSATDAVNKQYVDDKFSTGSNQWGESGGNVYRPTGNVGIGTSSPGASLEVAGLVKITGGTPGAGKVLTSDASGLASWTDPASTTPTGAAAGDLSGTYPNPTIASGAITDAKVAAGANIDQSKIANLTTDLADKQTSDSDLTALAGLGTTGVLVRTGTGTATTRSIVGTANRVSVTNGDGVGGNPTINISSTLLPSPVAGDAGKILKATGTDATSWGSLLLSDITTALGFTPINKAGDSITSGIFNYSGTAFVRVQDPVSGTDAANKQYVDDKFSTGSNQWSESGGNVYRPTGNVGVGTSAPSSILDVSTSSTGNDRNILLTNYSNWFGSSGIDGRKARGSEASPLIVNNGDQITGLGAMPYDGSVFQRTGAVFFVANGTVTPGSVPTDLIISTGSTATTERMRVNSVGNVGIGTATPATKLDVAGAVRVGTDATACAAGVAGAIRYNGGNVEYCNGTAWTAFAASGSGITSVNGLTAGTQTFATGTAGSAPTFNSATSTHTLNIPMASAAGVTAGLLSKTEYDSFNNKLGTTLDSGKIWVGNGSNVATAVAPSSDVSMTTTGAFTVTKLQGRAVSTTAPGLGSFLKWDNLLSQWAPSLFTNCNGTTEVLRYTLATDTWTCETLGINNLLPSQTANAGKVLTTDGTTASWQTTTNGTVTNVTASGPITVSSGTTTPVIGIDTANTTTTGALTSTDWNTFNNKLSSSLASGKLFVGNGSNVAAAVTMSGDATLSNAGVLTLGTVPLSKGGTGATTQAGAANAILPSQTGNSGKFLTTNGTNASWGSALTSESDTLATVTGRGATTATAVSLNGGANFPGNGVWNSSGRVGIGTTNPDSLLTIKGKNPILNILNNEAFPGSGSVLRFGHDQLGSQTPLGEIHSYLKDGSSENRAGDLIFSTASEGSLGEKMRITSDGNIGIGITNPISPLHISRTDGSASVILQSTSSTATADSALTFVNFNNTGSPFSTNRIEAFGARGTYVSPSLILKDDRLFSLVARGFSGTDGFLGFNLAAGIDIFADENMASGSSPGRLEICTTSTGSNFCLPRIVVKNSGNVGIGTETPDTKLDVNGVIRATDIILTSDQKAKHSIESLTEDSELKKLSQLNPVSFKWKETNKSDVGFIAQQLMKVYPELVIKNNDGTYSVKYHSLIAPITKAVQFVLRDNQELKVKNQLLETRISELEESQKKLDERLNKIERSLAGGNVEKH